MPTYVALLRGIAPMNPNMRNEKLRMVANDLGCTNVRTIIASGNVVFEHTSRSQRVLEKKMEQAWQDRLGFRSSTIIRSKQQINRLVETNPFKRVRETATVKPNVTFFKHTPDPSKLPKMIRGCKGYGFHEGAFCYTVDFAAVKTPEAMITLERVFGKEITTRTWNTVQKIQRAMQG